MSLHTMPPHPAPPDEPPTGADDVRPGHETDRMREMAALMTTIDGAQARLAELAGQAEATGEVGQATGLGLQTWLGTTGRMTRSDRLTLLAVTDRLAAMPATSAAWRKGLLSWSQVRILTRAARHLSVARARVVDEAIAEVVEEHRRYEPDQLIWRVDQLIWDLDDRGLKAAERAAVTDEFVACQPTLDGTGGRLIAEFGAVNFGVVTDALTRRAARHLHDVPPSKTADGMPDRDAAAASGRTLAAARGKGLVDLCRDDAAGGPSAGTEQAKEADPDEATTSAAQGGSPPRRPSAPETMVVAELDTLLDRGRMPGQLLTTLAGGRLTLSAAAARRLLDERGCDLRLLVIDDVGRVIGHGRRQRFARGWLARLVDVLDPVCTFPGCRTAGRVCQADHGRAWVDGGRTDIDDLANVCAAHHRLDTNGQWRRTTLADGTRRWRHARSGTTVDVPAATRRLRPPEHGTADPPRPGRDP